MRIAALIEALKQFILLVFFDTNTIILNRDDKMLLILQRHTDYNLSLARSIFQCVGDEVICNLVEIASVDIHLIAFVEWQKHIVYLLVLSTVTEVDIYILKEG